MINWLKEKLMKWFAIGKIVEFMELQQELNEKHQKELDILTKDYEYMVHLQLKHLNWHLQHQKEMPLPEKKLEGYTRLQFKNDIAEARRERHITKEETLYLLMGGE